MNIDASLRDRWNSDSNGWHIEVPPGWMQGRSAFGGLSVAIMAALARRHVSDAERSLRTVSVQLLSPVRPGTVQGQAHVLREGRNITFVEIRLAQDDTTVARATIVFARALDSTLDVAGPSRPDIPDPESLRSLPYIEGIVPEFTQHVDMRWVDGGMPFSGATRAEFTGLFRYRVPIGDAEGVLALLDTWPAPSLSMATKPIPASTVTWTAHLLAHPRTFDDWFTMRYETVVGRHGMHTVQGALFDGDGTLIAWSEQLVAVFG